MRRALCVLAAAFCVLVGESRAATLRDLFERTSRDIAARVGKPGFQGPIASAFAQSVARSVPVLSASAGFTYSFDLETGAFERSRVPLGQILLEQPETVGGRRWNVNLSYQEVTIDSIDGRDIHDLSDRGLPVFGVFTVPHVDLSLTTHQLACTTTYGVTDDLDLSLTLPLLYSRFELRESLGILDDESFKPTARRTFRGSASEVGVGDILLRAKYAALRSSWFRVSGGLALRLPSGNEDNFQGTGTFEVGPMVYAATRSFALGRWVDTRGFVNGGGNLNTDDVGGSELRWGTGLDVSLAKRFALGAALLGRHPLRGIGPPGFFNVDRLDPRTARPVRAPLLGLRGGRRDYYDLSVGGRVTIGRGGLNLFVNAVVPVNDDGLRSDVIPLAGLEKTF